MANIEITLKADKYKYPSSEEKAEALKSYPEIEFFHFDRKSILDTIFNENLPLKEAAREENLSWWNQCLKNRFRKLRETYIYLTTNYNRKFPDDFSKCSEEEAVNRFLFFYYSEIFYYYFFSTRDVIAQVLNIYCRIYKPENTFHFDKKFIKEIKDDKINKPANAFYKTVNSASGFRNAFTHRFSPTEMDYRAVVSGEGKKETLAVNRGDSTSAKEFYDNIQTSLKSLQKLMHELNKVIK